MFGGVASPVTHLTERGFGGIIPNQRKSEAVADALVGSAFTGSQYVASTWYKGDTISRAAAFSNFVGGGIGAGGASLIRFSHPSQRTNYFINDLFVPGFGTLIGGGALPSLLENHGTEAILYVPPIPQSVIR